jgi:hypothetical protein
MVEELNTIEQLERVLRLVQAGNNVLASQTLQNMIERRQDQVEQFELELEGFYGS